MTQAGNSRACWLRAAEQSAQARDRRAGGAVRPDEVSMTGATSESHPVHPNSEKYRTITSLIKFTVAIIHAVLRGRRFRRALHRLTDHRE